MDRIKVKKAGPWLWIPTLYFAEGLPYFIVNTIALAVFKDMGLDNGTLGLVTTIISLPWLIKPFWSPFVDIFRSKRWWILSMQVAMAVAVLLVALLLPVTSFTMILILFLVVAFASATHDIAADGFYMLALDPKNQSAFVGVRSTFYRIASVFGQGVLVVLAGVLQRRVGDVSKAWSIVLLVSALILAAITLYHFLYRSRPTMWTTVKASPQPAYSENSASLSPLSSPRKMSGSQSSSCSCTAFPKPFQ